MERHPQNELWLTRPVYSLCNRSNGIVHAASFEVPITGLMKWIKIVIHHSCLSFIFVDFGSRPMKVVAFARKAERLDKVIDIAKQFGQTVHQGLFGSFVIVNPSLSH